MYDYLFNHAYCIFSFVLIFFPEGLPSEVEILSSLVGDLKNQYHLKFRAQSAKDILTYKLMLRKVMVRLKCGTNIRSYRRSNFLLLPKNVASWRRRT